jgi:beta-xylosidase
MNSTVIRLTPIAHALNLLVAGAGCFGTLLPGGKAQHGVIREYAALAPKPDAVPLPALFDAPVTDTSITVGPDRAFYLTGSAASGDAAVFANRITIWRSLDMKQWTVIRTVDLQELKVCSPELHFLDGRFWLAFGIQGGGTALLRFDSTDLARSGFQKAQITAQGEDPSLFRDDDGTFFWTTGAGRIARMKANPLDGLAQPPSDIAVRVAGPLNQTRGLSISNLHGAFLTKISGKYHLFATGRIFRGGLGRTGLPEGVDDVLAAASERPDSGFSDFYVAFPNAGQTTVFRDSTNALWATYSGCGARAIVRGRPAAFRVEQVPATEAYWTVGFVGSERGDRFPFGLMLRPDTSFIYEGGMGLASMATLDKVPGQKATVPWIRDTFILAGHDDNYYLTGTSGNMDGINLWRSPDMKHFAFVKQVWTASKDPQAWYNAAPGRLHWAPELHYINGTYWLAHFISAGSLGKNSVLKSVSGGAEGPYESAFQENRGVDERIDSSMFQDTDGSAYYVWQDGLIRKLNRAMNGFAGEARKILPSDGKRVGYEGATLVKIDAWYVLTCAEWNGGGNHTDGTYDMMYSVAKDLNGPWAPRRVAVPHAGHDALFKDKSGRWLASLFGNDRTAPWRAMPGYVPVALKDTGDDLLIAPLDR